MNFTVCSVFDSYDLAYLASIKLKNTLNHIKILSIDKSAESHGDEDEKTFLPVYGWPYNFTTNYVGNMFPVMSIPVTVERDGRNEEYEPGKNLEAVMYAEAENYESAKKAVSMLVNFGGRNVHIKSAKYSK